MKVNFKVKVSPISTEDGMKFDGADVDINVQYNTIETLAILASQRKFVKMLPNLLKSIKEELEKGFHTTKSETGEAADTPVAEPA